MIIDGASPLIVDDPAADPKGKRVLVVEDGPTLTHGEMTYGAGVVAALRMGAAELVDPRPWAVGKLAETFELYPEVGTLLPAMGYGDEQKADLEETINAVDCDAVVIGTPIDLTRIIKINKPMQRVWYELQEIGQPNLEEVLARVHRLRGRRRRLLASPGFPLEWVRLQRKPDLFVRDRPVAR